MSSSVTASDGTPTAFGTNGTDTYYIALANTTNKPTAAQVGYALANVVASANPNVIAYAIGAPVVSPSGELTFEYDADDKTFNADAGAAAATYTAISTTGTTARPSTFDATDTAGSYVANLTLSFD